MATESSIQSARSEKLAAMIETLPFVSVVIPAYAAMLHLPKCLRAFDDQTYPKASFEIIVVDNGENPGLPELANHFENLKCVSESGQSSYISRNTGIRNAKGAVVVFTDADCVPGPAFLWEGVKLLESTPNCGLVGGRIRLKFKQENLPTFIERYEHATTFLQDVYISHNHATTSNIFTYKSVLDDVGGFNQYLKSLGDMEWSRRVSNAGYSLVYSDRAWVAHPTRGTFSALAKRSRRMAGGRYDLAKIKRWPYLFFVKDMVRTVLPLHRLKPIVLYREAGLWTKIRFLGVLVSLSAIEAGERIRLQLSNAESERS